MTSKIKVDNINKVSDDSNIIKKCGTTTTIGSGASNPIVVDGSAVTIGRCGGTVALASGATQTGFGRTGTVDWQTTPKTGDFTGANGEGYFINTTSGAITMTLPSASAGDIISIQDYNNTFDSNSCIIQAGSGVKINGGTAAGRLELSTEGQGLTLIYVDVTVGWRSIESTTFNTQSAVPTFITASGGNTTLTVGDFKTHIFTGPGTFTVCSVGNAAGSNSVDYLVVAGGGGSTINGGGAGAGGFRSFSSVAGTNSPLNAPAALPVSAQGYPITVGSGGTNGAPSGWPSKSPSPNGNPSTFSTITSAGGGGANTQGTCSGNGKPGGSGGGGGYPCGTAGTGNTPPTSPPQGQNGGAAQGSPGPHFAGGGGAAAAGCGGANPNKGGDGSFIQTGFIGPTAPSYGETGPAGRYFAGGGGGSRQTPGAPYPTADIKGGLGGGGNGAAAPESAGNNGTANTGGGAGTGNGGSSPGGAAGGSGIIMIRYKFQ